MRNERAAFPDESECGMSKLRFRVQYWFYEREWATFTMRPDKEHLAIRDGEIQATRMDRRHCQTCQCPPKHAYEYVRVVQGKRIVAAWKNGDRLEQFDTLPAPPVSTPGEGR